MTDSIIEWTTTVSDPYPWNGMEPWSIINYC
jgi:hypothetical protein